MKLYAGFIDLNNEIFEVRSCDCEEIEPGKYNTDKGCHINYATVLSQISKDYFDLTLHIGKTDSDKVYIIYSLDESNLVKKITDFVYKHNQQILERAQIKYL